MTRADPQTNKDVDVDARPELVFALVGPTGTDLDLVVRKLRDALLTVGYSSEEVRLSQLVEQVPNAPYLPLSASGEVERIQNGMDAGNRLCRDARSKDAMVALGILEIREKRSEFWGEPETENDTPEEQRKRRSHHAYIIRSLKRPEEADTLRAVYGPWVFLIGATRPQTDREKLFMAQVGLLHPLADPKERREEALRVIERDRDEANRDEYGQNVADTFPMADVFVDTRSEQRLYDSIYRFVQLIFGNRLRTPTPSEFAMASAHLGALRSAALSRQVGAAIVTKEGTILSIGCNDVPKAGGGQYWETDSNGRDHKLPSQRDPSRERREALLADVLNSLQKEGLLEAEFGAEIESDVVAAVQKVWSTAMRTSRLKDLIEFQRGVHAEMAAVDNAAMRGIPIRGAHLYTTTFPCHHCAKHIVDAGIENVFFIEPYPKSLVDEFYPDSISVDVRLRDHVAFLPFVGIAPRRYTELFLLSEDERIDKSGAVVNWEASKERASPTVGQPRSESSPDIAIVTNESVVISRVGVRDLYPQQGAK